MKDIQKSKSVFKRISAFISSGKNVKQSKALNETFILVEKTQFFDESREQTNELNASDDMLSYQNNSVCYDDYGINALPVEIICQIFSFLAVPERKNASLVCKKWRYAFLNNQFLSDILIKANNHLFISRPTSSASLKKSNQKSFM